MSKSLPPPSFMEYFPFLNQFILELVDAYQTGEINSWAELDEKVKGFFTHEQMEQMERLVPGWKKMASYSYGITLTHVLCVFLGVYMMPEFRALTLEEQQLARWIVLFHDLDKSHIQGKKDTMHAFHSGILAAHRLPTFGFPVKEKYHDLLSSWSQLTRNAYVERPGDPAPTPDNHKLPEILAGIDQLFGENTPASLITKVVLLHISLNISPTYPTPAPLSDAEVQRVITPELFPLLRVMMLGDTDGWSLFDPEARETRYKDALEVFEEVQRLIDSDRTA